MGNVFDIENWSTAGEALKGIMHLTCVLLVVFHALFFESNVIGNQLMLIAFWLG